MAAPLSAGAPYSPGVPGGGSGFAGSDPYSGYPGGDYGPDVYALDDADSSSRDRNRLIIVVVVAVAAALALLGLLWLLLSRGSGAEPSATAPTAATAPGGETAATTDNGAGSEAAAGGACAALLGVMTANDMPIEISVRLQELSNNQNAAANSAYFANINTQLQPSRDSYQQACLADISAGKEPATVRSFVTSFDNAVQTGLNVGAAVAAAGNVDPAQQQALTQAATQLEQANAALPAGSVSQSSLVGQATAPQPAAPAPDPASATPSPPSVAPEAATTEALSSGALVAPLPAATIDPFATATDPSAATTDPYATDPYATTPGTTSTTGVYDPYSYADPYATTPAATAPPADAALAAADNAADATKQPVNPTPGK